MFVLGNQDESFYASQGMNDYAHITDFDPTQDRLQLNGDSSYITAQIEHPDVVGTGVFHDADRNGLMGAGDDLIVVVSNQNSPVELERDSLKLV